MAAPGAEGAAPETLADLGEWELIRRLGAFAPAGAFDDDAALLAGGAGAPSLVVNTDVLVEGLHFSDATTAAADVGWRAAAANLSDLAAMGCGEVVGLTVGLVAPAATPWAWVEGVYGGLREALDRFGGTLLGGDCSGGGQRLLAVTALGRLAVAGGPIRRRDGRPGDRLLATGPHGLSRLGLALLQGMAGGGDPTGALDRLDPALAARAIETHRRPVPRFDAVRALIATRPPGAAWRVGGCDSSDGLAAAVRAIAGGSGCAARLERDALPLEGAMAGLPQAEAWCLAGGEDFELVLALEPGWAAALATALPGSGVIGELAAGPQATCTGQVPATGRSGTAATATSAEAAEEGAGLEATDWVAKPAAAKGGNGASPERANQGRRTSQAGQPRQGASRIQDKAGGAWAESGQYFRKRGDHLARTRDFRAGCFRTHSHECTQRLGSDDRLLRSLDSPLWQCRRNKVSAHPGLQSLLPSNSHHGNRDRWHRPERGFPRFLRRQLEHRRHVQLLSNYVRLWHCDRITRSNHFPSVHKPEPYI